MPDRHTFSGRDFLARFLPPDVEENVLGDLDEIFGRIVAARGRLYAQIWYAIQIVNLSPRFVLFRLKNHDPWRIPVNGDFFVRGNKWTAAAGTLALLPALFLVSIGLMFSFGSRDLGDLLLTRVYSGEWYWRIAHPALVLGGLLFAFLINSLSVASFKVSRSAKDVDISLKVRKSKMNLIVMAAGLVTLLILLLYAFGENLAHLL